MNFDITKVPFSAYGSYFVISGQPESPYLYIRDVHGGDEAPSCLCRIEPKHYALSDMEWVHTGTELLLRVRHAPELYAGFVIGDNDDLYIRTRQLALTLSLEGGSYDTLVPLSPETAAYQLSTKQLKLLFSCQKGHMTQQQRWTVRGSSDAVISIDADSEVAVRSYTAVNPAVPFASYEETRQKQARAFADWEKSFRFGDGEFEESRLLAAYITWMNFVHAEGKLTRDAMYMSKNWMYNIWSWDNCFAGIALSAAHPEKAYDQMKVFIDVQDTSGCYPDFVNDTFASFGFLKPPIHAWAFCKMIKQNPALQAEPLLREMYQSLTASTDFWLKHRQNQNAVFPVYYHGNDSGWDNASVFHRGVPVESPDLAALLIYQMDRLSELADLLGRSDEAADWKRKADAFFAGFFERFYEDGRFYAIYTPTREKIRSGNSLLMYLPIMIGYRFDKAILDRLVADLLAQFETPYGLATESPDSPYYRTGGYWLGPVWAPTTYLFIDALRACGCEEDARRLARKFFRLTEIGLMSENYDPFTGSGYDDPAFSWPSCVFLQLLKEFA